MSFFLHVLIVYSKGLQVPDVADVSNACILSRRDALITLTVYVRIVVFATTIASYIPVLDLAKSSTSIILVGFLQEILKASQQIGLFQIVNHGISKLMDDVTRNLFELFIIYANEEENFCSKASNKSCDVYGSGTFYDANKEKTQAMHHVGCKYHGGQPLLISKVGKPTTIMYTFLFKLDHERLYLFLDWTGWEDIKCLVDKFRVPQKDSFQLPEFMLLWRLAAGMFSLSLSFSLLLTALKSWQSRSCQYAGQVTMTLKLINLILSTTSHNDQGFDWFIKGALVHTYFSSHKSCFGIEIIGWEPPSIIVLDSNLEDKVLIRAGGIVMNGPGPISTKQPNTRLNAYVRDPRLINSNCESKKGFMQIMLKL